MKTKTTLFCGLLIVLVAGLAAAGQLPRTVTKIAGGLKSAGTEWTVLALQTPGEPELGAQLVSSNVVKVFWPLETTNYTLGTATNMAKITWRPSPEGVQTDGTNKFILMTPQSGVYYYRLMKDKPK